jgi:hypothetical protein
MRSISTWSRHHPWPARVLIVILQLYILFSAIITGLLVAGMWGEIPQIAMVISVVAFLALTLCYPMRIPGKLFGRKDYWRSRIMDALLIAASFCMVVTLTNRDEIAQVRSAASFPVIPVVYHGDGSTPQKQKVKRKEIRQQVRRAVHRVASGLKLWQAILLSVLLGAALIFSAIGVIALSCSAACSGLDGLAVVIVLAGGGLLAWLGILGYCAIWKEKKKKRRTR